MATPTPLANLIHTVLDKEQEWKYQLLANWQSVFGKFGDKVYLERIKNDTIIVAVYDACWMHELFTLSDVLIAAINEKLDKPYVKKLRFKQGKKKPQPHIIQSCLKPYLYNQKIILSDREKNALTGIRDPGLAQALHDFLVRCRQED